MNRPRWIIASLGCCLLLFAYVLYPLLAMAWDSLRYEEGFSLQHYSRTFTGEALQGIWNSIWVSLLSTLGAGFIGVPAALLLHTRQFPGRRLCALLMFAPLMLPPLVGMFAFWLLISDIGFFPKLLQFISGSDRPVAAISGIAAVIIVHAYSFSVYFYALCAASLQRRDPALIEAARNLGAGRWRCLHTVTLPQLWPSIASAAALSFMLSMGSFSAPYILANSTPFLSVLIYEVCFAEGVMQPDYGLAAALSVIGALICIVFLLLTRRWQQQAQSRRATVAQHLQPLRSGWRLLASAGAAVLCLLMLLPQLYITLIAFCDYPAWDNSLLPSRYTMENFTSLFDSANAMRPIWNSAVYSLLALVACLIWALSAAGIIVHSRLRISTGIDICMMLPLALPGTVIAFSLLRAFSIATPQTFFTVLAHSVWLLPLAYCIRCLPLALRPLLHALESADPAHDEAARSLGASTWRRLRTIVIPHVWPALTAAGILVYVTCLGEFVASFMLYRHDNLPIAVYMYQIFQSGIAQAAAYSVLLMALMVLAAIAQQLLKRRQHGLNH